MNLIQGNMSLIIEIIVAVLVLFFILLVVKLAQNYWSLYAEKISLDHQFDEALSGELDAAKANGSKLLRSWNHFWEKKLVASGVKLGVKRENAGMTVILFDIALIVVLTLVFSGSVFGALLVTVFVNVAMSFVLGFYAEKKLRVLSNQIPAFLSSLRAANDTSSSTRTALLQAISITPKELHAELSTVEEQLQAGGQIKQVLTDFYNTTVLDELRFLMACIVLVNESGKDMSEQIQIIQDIVEARLERERHLHKAVMSVMPTIYTSLVIIPGLFLYLYCSQPIARQFWFHSIISWILFLVATGFFMLGLWLSKHQVDKIKNL